MTKYYEIDSDPIYPPTFRQSKYSLINSAVASLDVGQSFTSPIKSTEARLPAHRVAATIRASGVTCFKVQVWAEGDGCRIKRIA